MSWRTVQQTILRKDSLPDFAKATHVSQDHPSGFAEAVHILENCSSKLPLQVFHIFQVIPNMEAIQAVFLREHREKWVKDLTKKKYTHSKNL